MGGRIFIGIFGLPFLAVGIWAFYSITSNIIDWNRMQHWETVQAKVIDGGVKESHGDDSTTYAAHATYQYFFRGENHTGTRTAISEGSDNIGHFNQELGSKIEAARGGSIDIYVNPDKPDEAIINRDLRWGMIGFKAVFLLAFGGVGLGMVLGAILAPKSRDEKYASQPQFAGAQWLANDKWQTNEIASQSKYMMYFAWGFTLLWNLISMPLPFLLVEEIRDKHNYPALLGLLFPLVGIGLLIWSIRQTIEWKKFGLAPVALDPFPGSIGGQVGGTLELPNPFDSTVKYVFTLSSVYSYWSGSGKNSERRETIKWTDTAVGYAEQGLYGTRLSFRFDVPEGLTPSDAVRAGRDYYLWRLNLTADMPGVDVDRDYEIPVYATKQKSANIDKRVVESSQLATLEMDDANARKRVRILPGMMGGEMFYPMGRNISSALVGVIIGLIFCGVGATIALIKEGSYIFGGIFGFIGALLTLCSFYMAVNSLSVRLDEQGNIVAVRRIFGIPVKTGTATKESLLRMEMSSTFSTTSGNKQIKHYTITAPLLGVNKLVIGEGFRGEGEAESAMQLIRDTFGVVKPR